MPAKNDLSAFKQKTPAATLVDAPRPAVVTAPPQPVQTASRGRKAKSVDDKEGETVALKFTQAELATIVRKAGLVPKGTFLKHVLRTQTDLFK